MVVLDLDALTARAAVAANAGKGVMFVAVEDVEALINEVQSARETLAEMAPLRDAANRSGYLIDKDRGR